MLDLREIQRPIKQRYREDPEAAVIRSTARCTAADPNDPRTALLEAGPLRVAVGAHAGVGGTGEPPCSGDLLVAALAACQQITAQMVAAALGIRLAACETVVTGELDLRGTMGIAKDAGVGYRALACELTLLAPEASAEQVEKLAELARRFCVVHATLEEPPRVEIRVGTG